MTRPSYAWDARDYAKHSTAQFSWAKELIEKLNLTGNESVLDIGCGDGKVTAQIAENLPAGRYIDQYPRDSHGQIHVDMVRLEIEAVLAGHTE
jgi:SAM-dependent methyltransferase